MAEPRITAQEWLTELERLKPKATSDGMTAQEIAKEVGHGIQWVREKIIAPGLLAGRIVRDERASFRIDGRMGTVPIYRIVGKGKP